MATATAKVGGKSLVRQVGDSLREDILAGRVVPGDKLPSQLLLTERFDVSRTVVREAIASLEADGLLEARQGAGVFVVSKETSTVPFRMVDGGRLSSMLEMLELRTAVEMEAAGLAALRRSPAQEEAIYQALQVMAEQIAHGERSTVADLAFHRAVAAATNNPRFPEFLDMLGQSSIPRASAQGETGEAGSAPYLARIQEEHRRIAQTISAGDEAAARDAMRAHLKGSQDRYRALAQRGLP